MSRAYETKIYGHRGAASDAPENTMESFKLAHQLGADGIEFDVQLSKDGHLVVIHDESVNRTSDGSGFVHDFTLKELREFDFSKPKPVAGGSKIPTLQEVLEEFKNTDLLLNIELKNSIVRYPGMEELVLQCVQEFGYMGRTIFSSFSHPSMIKLRNIDPAATIAFLFAHDILDVVDYMNKYGVNIAHPVINMCYDTQFINEYHAAGKSVNIWTVDRGSDIRMFCDMGVDGIVTNRVGLAVEIKRDRM